MGMMMLLVTATKVVGVMGALTVAANSFAYRRFYKKNLAPFENPVDESHELLASFPIHKDERGGLLHVLPPAAVDEEGGFFFALATAPAHVEDELQDSWLEFAKDTKPPDDPAGDPPDVRTGADPRAAPTFGISLTEELQAAEIKEAGQQELPAGFETLAPEGSKSVIGEEFANKGDGKSGDQSVSEDKVGLVAMAKSETPTEAEELPRISAKNGKDGKGGNGGLASDWEVVSEKDNSDEGEEQKLSAMNPSTDPERGRRSLQQLPAKKGPKKIGFQTTNTEDPRVLSVQGKARKLMKVSMEAMIRGYEKMTEPEEKHNVAAWQNAIHPEERVRFWSDPDTELKLAQGAHQTVFRMGVDWGRIMPIEPVDGIDNAVNWEAVKRYRYIIERVLAHGMRVMLTLFHHSMPSWAAEYGGWKEKKTIKYFLDFTRLAVEQYGDLVDYWITINEPHVFAMLTYCAGAWPGGDPNLLETATAAMPRGVFKVVMQMMADAHLEAYDIIHDLSKSTKKVKVGVSHHVSFMRPYGLFDVPLVVFSNWMTRFAFCDDIAHKCDFLGINYYGQEVVSAPGLKNVEDDEYSESGRGVYPDGLYRMLIEFHERYKKYNLPFIITENGVSDSTDIIRRPYIIEHLLAVRAAMDKGVRVQGYCFWTISDNWEWADGYGPKFGLVAVDRHKNLDRHPRPSYYLYAELSKTGKVTRKQRQEVWEELQSAARRGMTRPFCRAINDHGLMFAGGLDVPIDRPFAVRDWRFGHYEVEGLQDPLSSVVRYFREGAMFRSHGRNCKPKVHLDSKLV